MKILFFLAMLLISNSALANGWNESEPDFVWGGGSLRTRDSWVVNDNKWNCNDGGSSLRFPKPCKWYRHDSNGNYRVLNPGGHSEHYGSQSGGYTYGSMNAQATSAAESYRRISAQLNLDQLVQNEFTADKISGILEGASEFLALAEQVGAENVDISKLNENWQEYVFELVGQNQK